MYKEVIFAILKREILNRGENNSLASNQQLVGNENALHYIAWSIPGISGGQSKPRALLFQGKCCRYYSNHCPGIKDITKVILKTFVCSDPLFSKSVKCA